MESDHDNLPSPATVNFEQSLERLVLESFAAGVPVEGSWDVTVPLGDAPNWSVTIEKSYSVEESSYQPETLEE